MRWKGIVLLGCLMLGACAAPGSASPSPTPRQVLEARMRAFVAARSVSMAGHVTLSGKVYRLTLQTDDAGQVAGTVDVDQASASVVLAGGRAFRNDGRRWALDRSEAVPGVLTRLADRRALASAVLAAAGTDVAQRRTNDPSGAPALKLTGSEFSAFVPVAGSGPPTRLVTGVDSPLADGLAALELDLSAYGEPAHIAAPDPFYDPNDMSALPPSFAFVYTADGPTTWSWDNCDRSGCTVSAAFVNNGGRAGTSTATFFISRGGVTLTTCDVAIPLVDHGQSTRAGCRASFDNSTSVTGTVRVRNPDQ